jgi:hypothetical protein
LSPERNTFSRKGAWHIISNNNQRMKRWKNMPN